MNVDKTFYRCLVFIRIGVKADFYAYMFVCVCVCVCVLNE